MIKEICVKSTNIDGVLEITSPGWNGGILRMSHRGYQKWRRSSSVRTAAVYILYADHFDKGVHGSKLYVGQTGGVDQRLDQHVAGKNFWGVVLVFFSAEDWMNIAHAKNIEHRFIEWAKHANRYTVDNGNDSAPTYLGEDDISRVDEFLADVRPILTLANIDVFEPNYDGTYEFAGDGKYRSVMRIADDGATKKVEIVAGSEILYLDDNAVQQAGLVGITYDSHAQVHHFSQSVLVSVDMSLTPKVFNQRLTNWRSPCGVLLSKALKESSGSLSVAMSAVQCQEDAPKH